MSKLSVIIVLILVGATAVAADISRGATVSSRARADYDAEGIRVRGFQFLPALTVDLMANDNIRPGDTASLGGTLSDIILLLAPELVLRSDWSRNELNLGFDALSGHYDEYDNENFDDYKYWVDGRLEFASSSWLFGQLKHEHLHELRTSPNDQCDNPDADEPLTCGLNPTEFDINNVTLRYRYAPGRFYASLGLAVDFITYGDTDFEGGSSQSNAGRDRTVADGRLRLGYQVSPGYSGFVEGRLYDINYDLSADLSGANRDSEGADLVGGAEIDISGVTSGEIFVGYREFKYADPQFQTQDGPIFGASVDWNITQLTTVNFVASQRIFGTTIDDSAGIETVLLGVSVDHELLRNVLLNAKYEQSNEDFLDIVREDEIKRFEVGGLLLLGKNMRLNAGYIYQKRDSNVSTGLRFTINQIFIGFRAQI